MLTFLRDIKYSSFAFRHARDLFASFDIILHSALTAHLSSSDVIKIIGQYARQRCFIGTLAIEDDFGIKNEKRWDSIAVRDNKDLFVFNGRDLVIYGVESGSKEYKIIRRIRKFHKPGKFHQSGRAIALDPSCLSMDQTEQMNQVDPIVFVSNTVAGVTAISTAKDDDRSLTRYLRTARYQRDNDEGGALCYFKGKTYICQLSDYHYEYHGSERVDGVSIYECAWPGLAATYCNVVVGVDHGDHMTVDSCAMDAQERLYVTMCARLARKDRSGSVISLNGFVFVVDLAKKQIVKRIGEGVLNMPTGIAVSPVTGDLLVCDANQNQVIAFCTEQGQELYHLGSGLLNRPYAIAAAKDGTVYVRDNRGVSMFAIVI